MPSRETWRLGVVSLEPWDHVWRRNQHLVDRLLALDPALSVIFVGPPRDPLHELSQRRAPRTGSGVRHVPGYDGRLATAEATKWLPGRAGPVADRVLDRQVATLLGGSGLPDALWINDPRRAGVSERLGVPALYDITDDWTLAPRPARERQRLQDGDRTLLQRADAVVVCSPALQESKGGELVRNAVDVEDYRRPRPRPDDLSPRSAVYCGTLHEDRLDVDLVVAAGARLAQTGSSLALVGPVALSEANGRRLLQAPGVAVLGSRPYQEVPAYLQHADALVVPHIVDSFTATLDPIKLYEYLAVGRPILATPCAGFVELADPPALSVVGADEFPASVAALIDHPVPTVHRSVPDWAERAGRMHEILMAMRTGRTDGAGARS